jgi:hypothetical protein
MLSGKKESCHMLIVYLIVSPILPGTTGLFFRHDRLSTR